MTSPAVVTTDLTKRYGADVLAVDGVSLRVERGELYAFLGLNGAGKSTTIRMLLGMIRPTSGRRRCSASRSAPRPPTSGRGSGISSSRRPPTPSSRCARTSTSRGGCSASATGAVVSRAIDRLGLGPYRGPSRAATCRSATSSGWRWPARMLHAPELLVLDEPANGLDPAGVIEIRELLRELVADGGSTVFMSSHILAEVDLLATRIGIVHRGRLIEELDSDALRRHRDPRLEVAAPDIGAAEAALTAGGYAPGASTRRRGHARASRAARPRGARGHRGRCWPRPARRRATSRSPGRRSRTTSSASPALEAAA